MVARTTSGSRPGSDRACEKKTKDSQEGSLYSPSSLHSARRLSTSLAIPEVMWQRSAAAEMPLTTVNYPHATATFPPLVIFGINRSMAGNYI